MVRNDTIDSVEWINMINMFELKTNGRFYLFTKIVEGNVSSMSRIDHAFRDSMWMSNFGEAAVQILDPRLSNHSPLVVQVGETSCRKNMFRLLDSITASEVFRARLQSLWESVQGKEFVVYGENFSRLVEWLNRLKVSTLVTLKCTLLEFARSCSRFILHSDLI